MDTKALRQKILDLAIRGKLVPQDPNDEPASVLLERIRTEKERLIAEGKIKRPKKAKASSSESHYRKFEIPDSWEWVKIEDIGEVITGNTPPKDNQAYYGGDIPFYKPTDLDQGIKTSCASDSLSIEGYNISRKLPVSSILVTCIGATIGKTGLILTEGSCNQQINAVITGACILPKFLFYTCVSEYFQNEIKENASATTLPILNKNNFSVLFIPLPPKEEQERIVDEIERLLTKVERIELNCGQLEESLSLTKSKILELAMQGKLVPQDPSDEPAADMLRRVNPKARIITDNPHYPQLPDNWVLTTIGSVCNYGSCINIPVEDIPENGWVLELEDIEKDSGKVIDKLPKKTRQINGVRHRFKSGDVLYSKLRTYLNKVFIADEDGFCTPEIIPIKSGEMMDSEFLCLWLRSPYFLAYTASCGYGVKMPRLSTQDARKGIVPLPPLEDQKRIVKAIKDTYVLMENIVNQIN